MTTSLLKDKLPGWLELTNSLIIPTKNFGELRMDRHGPTIAMITIEKEGRV